MKEAAPTADVILTCTGQIDILGNEHIPLLQDGTVLGNVGHFNQEIDVTALFRNAELLDQARDGITRIRIREDGKYKTLHLISQGRVINLAAAEGHPPDTRRLKDLAYLFCLGFNLSIFKPNACMANSDTRSSISLGNASNLLLTRFNFDLFLTR